MHKLTAVPALCLLLLLAACGALPATGTGGASVPAPGALEIIGVLHKVYATGKRGRR